MNRNTTIVLVVIFAGLLLYVLAVQLPRDRAAADITPTPFAAATPVWPVTVDQIMGVRLVDQAAGRSVAFEKDSQGIWSVTEPQAGQADQAQASGSAGSLANLSVMTTITAPADLSAFGVLSPTYTLEVSLADGTQHSAAIGAKAPTGRGYYLLQEGMADVLIVNAGSIDGLIALLDNPPYFVPTATPTAGADFLATLAAINPSPGTAATATPPAASATP